jgi:hypothetical protein
MRTATQREFFNGEIAPQPWFGDRDCDYPAYGVGRDGD